MMTNSSSPALAPVARKQPTATTLHGHTLYDDYGWLRDKENPETIAYLAAENAYTEAAMRPLDPLIERLYQEMLSHIQQTDVSVPYRDGAFDYYSRTKEGQQYPIYCRVPAASGSAPHPVPPLEGFPDEEILLDVNQLAEGEAFMALGALSISDDGDWLAYTTDNTGFRQYTLHVKNLRTGKTLQKLAERVGSVVWATDNRTLFYSVEEEETKRPFEILRRTREERGDEIVFSAPLRVFQEADERFNVGVGRTRDKKYLIVESGSHTTSEGWFLDAAVPAGKLQCIVSRRDNIEYYVDHRDGRFYIRVNDTGRNFRLVSVPVDNCGPENWQEMLPHRDDVMLEDADLFADFFVACERHQGLPRLRVHSFSGSAVQEISFPEPTYTAGPGTNREFQTSTYRYGYTSLVTPSSVFDYDVNTGASTLRKQVHVPGGFDRSLYASERVFATAPDGVQVPVSLVYRKDRFTGGKNPLYVYAYGSYGYSLPIGFNSNRLSLLDRGVVLAYAHIRGGGDMGKPWHDAGRMMRKMNTFTDFIAAAEHLANAGYGDRNNIIIEGGSAGGLLMGAVTNLRPDLFRVVLSHVPFVDVMNTMLDASLPLTVGEYEEWGNPNEEAAFRYMLQYSPYDNIEAKAYPAMLVRTSLNDSQVMYWEPAKYVAKLRSMKTDRNVLLLHTNMQAGHGGASGRYDYLKEIAFDYAFLLWQAGVEKSG